MKKIVSIFVLALGFALIFVAIGCAFIAYFIGGSDSDGWGRMLYDPPLIVRSFWPGMQWPGWKWFAIDAVVFWGTIGIASFFIKLHSKIQIK